MIAIWAGFARTGHAPFVLSLEHDLQRVDIAERHQCDLWSAIP